MFVTEAAYSYICCAAETAPRPSYPSSKSKKDWDKLEAEVKKEVWSRYPIIYQFCCYCFSFSNMTGCMIRIYQEKDEKLDGDAALNKFFRDIYKDADEDMRRAMMKSFVCDL